jgi:hypothetical protein
MMAFKLKVKKEGIDTIIIQTISNPIQLLMFLGQFEGPSLFKSQKNSFSVWRLALF